MPSVASGQLQKRVLMNISFQLLNESFQGFSGTDIEVHIYFKITKESRFFERTFDFSKLPIPRTKVISLGFSPLRFVPPIF